jgi:MoaA/NifB/PqqE/SkfB family radical SAM enzyme
MENGELAGMMNGAIGRLVETATRIALADFSAIPSFLKILKYQKAAGELRLANERGGLHVPPFIISSIVRSCNLRCKGCYDRAKQDEDRPASDAGCATELDTSAWRRIFGEARELGVSFMLLAGGEPLLRAELIRSCADFPEIIFPVFTNGVLIDGAWADFFASARNVIPVVSLEGDSVFTDARRGEGVYASVEKGRALLKKRNVLYGISITLTSENFGTVLDDRYISPLVGGGAHVFFFVEYVPFDGTSATLCVTDAQKAELPARLSALRSRFPSIFLDFPGDEAAFGGCLASGRGFVHINASGSVESCPFAPYSDTAVSDRSLSAALASPTLARIRDLQATLGHTGGCTLFENRETVERLLAER